MMKTTVTTEINPSASKKSSRRRLSPPPFSGSTLEQVLQFVLPEDVARASMVCKMWRDELMPTPPKISNTEEEADVPSDGVITMNNSSKAIWKQAVINSNPKLMQAIITSSVENEETANTQQQIDFYALAKSGLGRKRKNLELPEPSFQIEDLLIVLEVKQKKVTMDENGKEKISFKSLGTFFHNGNQDMLQPKSCGEIDFDLTKGPEILLEGQNPLCPDTYYDSDTKNGGQWKTAKAKFRASLLDAVNRGQGWCDVELPYWNAGENALNNLVTSVTLFRRDDWRSYCLFDNYQMEIDSDFYRYHNSDHSETNDQFDVCARPHWQPFAHNGPGSVAQQVLVSKEILKIQANANIVFKCVLPPSSSLEEPSWLEQFRRTKPEDMDWTEPLDDEIAQVKTFQFRLISIFLGLVKDANDDSPPMDVDDSNTILLVLEGLDWK